MLGAACWWLDGGKCAGDCARNEDGLPEAKLAACSGPALTVYDWHQSIWEVIASRSYSRLVCIASGNA